MCVATMECIKDKALRAKEMAEKKLEEQDLVEAKRFALKAQNLNPKTDGLRQLMATLDVYISAEKGINGESDWYRVLGVGPLTDEPTIRNQFKKLAYVIHPDRNKSVGALGAFKLLTEALSTLSDKTRRDTHDQKWNLRCKYENILERKSSAPDDLNGLLNLSNNNVSSEGDHRGTNHSQPPPDSSSPIKPTFLTCCYGCKTQFEYPRVYLYRTLLCSNCYRPFHTNELPTPRINDNRLSNPSASHMQRHNSSKSAIKNSSSARGTRPASNTSVEWARFSCLDSLLKTSEAGFFSEAKEKEKGEREGSAGSMWVPTSVNDRRCWKRKFKEGAIDSMTKVTKTSPYALTKEVGGVTPRSSAAGLGILPKGDKTQKGRMMTEHKMATLAGNGNEGVAAKTVFGSQEGGMAAIRWNMVGNRKLNMIREMSQKDMRKMLMEKAKKVIHGKLIERRDAAVPKIQYKSKEMKENEKGKKEVTKPGVKADVSNYSKHVDIKKKESTGKIAPRKIDLNLTPDIPDPVSMTVIDPDFYDFDRNRMEGSFGSNQVWAAYDQEDGMPRYYVMIHSVISVEPFRMKISWLNSKSNDEFGPLSWIASGFPKTSGDFRAGRNEVYSSLNSFSHQVKWMKGTRGVVQIYPLKGDVWALYRNWSPDWNEHIPDDVIHKYDMVQVLEDYNEARGVRVYPLAKVAGFKTVFCRHWDARKVRTIPREEMFRFSHQVPSHLLTGKEGLNAPKGCLELDPAATPLELLQVIAEVHKEETVRTAEKPKEEELRELLENHKPSIGKDLVHDAEKVVAEKKGKENGGGKLVVYNRRRIREQKKF